MASDKPNFPSDRADKFMLRFPDGMRDQIAEAAKANGRSMNAEIIQRLQNSLASDAFAIEDAPKIAADDAATALALKVLEVFGSAKERAQADRWKEKIAAKKTAEDKTVLLRPLVAEAPEKTSATPAIPGQNLRKKGLGAAPKEPKVRKPRTTVQKRRVVADDKETDK